MEPKETGLDKAEKTDMTELERSLLRALRNLYTWVNDGSPGSKREIVLTDAQKQVAAGEAKELQ